jgi:hypothetical protein
LATGVVGVEPGGEPVLALDAAGVPEAVAGLDVASDAGVVPLVPDAGVVPLVPDAGVVPLAPDAGVASLAPDPAAELLVFESPPPPLHPAIAAASSTSIKRSGRCKRFMCIPLYRTVGAGGRMLSGEHGSIEQ